MNEESRSPRATRGGGSEARRAARGQRKAGKLPYIRRRLPVIDLLSQEAVEIIENNAEVILEEVGVEFRRDPESLRLWRGAGADVQGERVHIPRGLARALLRTASAACPGVSGVASQPWSLSRKYAYITSRWRLPGGMSIGSTAVPPEKCIAGATCASLMKFSRSSSVP